MWHFFSGIKHNRSKLSTWIFQTSLARCESWTIVNNMQRFNTEEDYSVTAFGVVIILSTMTWLFWSFLVHGTWFRCGTFVYLRMWVIRLLKEEKKMVKMECWWKKEYYSLFFCSLSSSSGCQRIPQAPSCGRSSYCQSDPTERISPGPDKRERERNKGGVATMSNTGYAYMTRR